MNLNLLARARPQFAQADRQDFAAICATCRKQHLIPRREAIGARPWLDWLAKHGLGHETFLVPARLLAALGERLALADNANVNVAYAASAAYTITLTGLATDSNLLAGRESTSLSNASNKYLDELVAGQITTGTSPTANKQIEVHAVGALDDTPTWPDVFDGTESAETIGATADGASIKPLICRNVATMPNAVTTSNVPYAFAPVGLRQLFGDGLPPAHVLFVTHNTGVNLNATGSNQFLKHTPVYATVA